MNLSDHDLRQLDDAYLDTLTLEQARVLLGKALADLKAARERLGQNPSNSSRPPSTRAPWDGTDGGEEEAAEATAGTPGSEEEDPSAPPNAADGPPEGAKVQPNGAEPRRPGRRQGAPGHSRTQRLAVDAEHTHAPGRCAGCGAALNESHEGRAHTARYEIDRHPAWRRGHRAGAAAAQAHLPGAPLRLRALDPRRARTLCRGARVERGPHRVASGRSDLGRLHLRAHPTHAPVARLGARVSRRLARA